MLFTAASALLVGQAIAGTIAERQGCPNIHVFGARETTAPPGYGSSATVVNLVLDAYPDATAEAIDYPACGGQSSCGGVSYSNSVRQGINSVASTVNSFNSRCPDTQLVLVGYSQGAEIMDVALCGGGNPNQGFNDESVQLSSSAVNMVKAAIFMGDPMWVVGLPYEVGTCKAGGFDARPSGFNCPSGNKIQSYCDAPDPYCCNGNSQQTHQSYDTKYGDEAFAFIQSQLSSGNGNGDSGGDGDGGGDTGDNGDGGGNDGGSGGTVAQWGQCGGNGYSGPTTCESPYTCQKINDYYSQCQ